jgi:hypothetical protein
MLQKKRMNYIKQFVKNNKLIFILIVICLLVDSFLLYNQGIQREATTSKAYVDFITNYPESIKSPRVEPLFVVITYYLSRLFNPLLVLASLKLLLVAIQLFTFYKIIILLTKKRHLALAFTAMLNFSFAFFSLYNNLSRNHFANTLFLLALFYLLSILEKNKNTLPVKKIILISLFGGLLIYSHILPTILFNTLLLLSFVFFATSLLLSYRIQLLSHKKKFLLLITKNLFLIGIFTFIIQLPYLLRLYNSNVTTDDYQQAGSIVNEKSTSLLDLFRILFEFRLPGISLIFMLLIALSIFYLLKKITPPRILLLILWLTTYFCTKLDLIFGIGMLPYRFSLMLIFSSLLLLSVLFTPFILFIKNGKGKQFFVLIIVLSFITTNLSPIMHAAIFRNYIPNHEKQDLFRHLQLRIISETTNRPTTFLINGESFEKIDTTSKYLRNDTLFAIFDEKTIVDYYNTRNIDFVIFDHFRINEKGEDINTVTNTNLSFYEKSSYFQKIDEVINPYIHISIFKFIPNSAAVDAMSTISFDCSTDKLCQQKFEQHLKNIDTQYLNNWVVEITESSNINLITEYVHSENKLISLTYTKEITSKNNSRSFPLRNIPLRKNLDVPLMLHIPNAKILLHHTGFTIDRMELQKIGVDKLTIFGKINNHPISYFYVNSAQTNILISIISIALILIFYIYLIISSTNRKVFRFTNAKQKKIILSLIFFIIIDILFLNALFINIYKLFLHI